MKYTSKQAVELAMEHITDWEKEHAIGIYLSADAQIKAVELLTIGTQIKTLITPREFFRPAIRWAAIAGILLHNHPVDCLKPSVGDLSITKQMDKAGVILGIPLIDHLIFNQRREFFSFTKEKLIKDKVEKILGRG